MQKLLSLIIAASIFNVNAQSNTTQSVYNQVCQVAKQKGFEDAKTFAKEQGIFISRNHSEFQCQGMPIGDYAKSKVLVNKKPEATLVIKEDNSSATALCLKAAEVGVRAVAKKNSTIRAIKCNGLTANEFVKQVNSAI